MNSYINREEALRLIADYTGGAMDKPTAKKLIRGMKEAVVRCKDCRWGGEACGNIECFADINGSPEYHGYEWFCPNGERREDDTD